MINKLVKPYYIGDIHTVSYDDRGMLSEVEILDRHGELVLYMQTYVQPRVTEFVRAVNEYDGLVKQIIILKQLLSKCNPFSITGHCKICKCDGVFEHEDNCEYVESTGEEL